jgi:hypothetical protein
MQSDWIKKYKKQARVLVSSDKIGMIKNALSNMQKFKVFYLIFFIGN